MCMSIMTVVFQCLTNLRDMDMDMTLMATQQPHHLDMGKSIEV